MHNVPPKGNYIPIPRTCEYVKVHGKRDFANMIKVTDFEMGE